ncbi:GTP cyclohydrolase II [Sunxiuqinia sp. A32]|uniref:GTP cyclohydrolase II n=1 Tax=Sunxiuqinia sp. A32 TaxID=3461496 RepID=UPI0040461FB7
MFEIPNKERPLSEIEIGERIKLPTSFGDFEFIPFREISNGMEHMILIKGNPNFSDSVLTRIHSACATGDLFGSLRCDCGQQLKRSLQKIEEEKTGILIYLQQEGRGIGLMEKIKAYKLQENGLDTVDANLQLGHQADERNYLVAAKILHSLNIKKIRLMTNNPAKRKGLEENNIFVENCIPLIIPPNEHNSFYLKTKLNRMGHLLSELNFENYEHEN